MNLDLKSRPELAGEPVRAGQAPMLGSLHIQLHQIRLELMFPASLV